MMGMSEDMSQALRERWTHTLTERYAFLATTDLITHAVDTLASIYLEFKARGLADPGFDSQLQGEQYNQRLGEMLLFHYLSRNGFDLTSHPDGPDFVTERDGKTVYFELVTPGPGLHDALGVLDAQRDRLHPDPSLNADRSREALLRITGAFTAKASQYRDWLDKTVIEPSNTRVVVINDAQLCPDLMFYGMTHTLDPGPSGCPMIVEALLGEGMPYFTPPETPGAYNIHRTYRTHVLKLDRRTNTHTNISTTYFHDPHFAHVSAVLQLTLREDYALGLELANYAMAKPGSESTAHQYLPKGVLVCNPMAAAPFSVHIPDANHWMIEPPAATADFSESLSPATPIP